jgi:S-adenosylmethionine-diacylglycerol 3-amino-3-carboxypropyl transferase
LRELDLPDYKALFGFDAIDIGAKWRASMIAALALPQDVRAIVNELCNENAYGEIIYYGRFEKTLQSLSGIFRFIVGGALDTLFACKSLQEQKEFFLSKSFPMRRWNTALCLLGNGTVLNAILYRGQFPKKNISGSTFENYKRIFHALLTQVYCRESFFLQMLSFGRLQFPDACCIETNERVYADAKAAVATTDVRFVQGDIFALLRGMREEFDFVSLSDVPSFLAPQDENSFLGSLSDCMRHGGRIAFRGHLRVIAPTSDGYRDLTSHFRAEIARERTQLWQVRLFERLAPLAD